MKKLENEEMKEIDIEDYKRQYMPNLILITVTLIIHISVIVYGFLNNLYGTRAGRYIAIFSSIMCIFFFIQKRILDKPFKDPKVRIKDLDTSFDNQNKDYNKKEKRGFKIILISYFLMCILLVVVNNMAKASGILDSSYGVYIKVFSIICFIITCILLIILKKRYKKYW